MHGPSGGFAVLTLRPAVRFESCFSAGFGRDRNLHATTHAFGQEHGLLNDEIRKAVLSGSKHLLGSRQALLDVGGSWRHHGALNLVVLQVGGRICREPGFEKRVGPNRGKWCAEQGMRRCAAAWLPGGE